MSGVHVASPRPWARARQREDGPQRQANDLGVASSPLVSGVEAIEVIRSGLAQSVDGKVVVVSGVW